MSWTWILSLKLHCFRMQNSYQLENSLQNGKALLSTYENKLAREEIAPSDVTSLEKTQRELAVSFVIHATFFSWSFFPQDSLCTHLWCILVSRTLHLSWGAKDLLSQRLSRTWEMPRPAAAIWPTKCKNIALISRGKRLMFRNSPNALTIWTDRLTPGEFILNQGYFRWECPLKKMTQELNSAD